MAKKKLEMIIFVIILNYQCILSYANHESVFLSEDEKDKIDDYILGFKFDRNQVLTDDATVLTKIIPKEGYLDENTDFTVITREVKTVSKSEAEIGFTKISNIHRIYPGCFLLANSRLMDNIPDIVPIKRSPMRYMVSLPGFAEGENIFNIIPNFSDYMGSSSVVLETWFQKHSHNYDIGSDFQFGSVFVHTKEQLRVQMGVGFKNSVLENSIDFESVINNEKTIMITKFRQAFYRVLVQTPENPSDLFDSTVKVKDVMAKMNAKDPPVIVDTVTYGRLIYIVTETTSADESMRRLLAAKYGGLNWLENEDLKKNAIDNLIIKVFIGGGGAEQLEIVNPHNFEYIKNLIDVTGNFSRKNIGRPISYTIRFINDNTAAKVYSRAEYAETTIEVFKNGFLWLEQLGYYVASFFISWKEIYYDENGRENFTSKQWHGNDYYRYKGWTDVIHFPGNARDIDVTIQGATGLAWAPWHTSFERKNIPLIPKRKITVWGTSLNQKSEMVPEQWE